MKGYCITCGKLIDETESMDAMCFDCYYHPKKSKKRDRSPLIGFFVGISLFIVLLL